MNGKNNTEEKAPSYNEAADLNAGHAALTVIKVARLLRYWNGPWDDLFDEVKRLVDNELRAHPESYPAELERRAHDTI